MSSGEFSCGSNESLIIHKKRTVYFRQNTLQLLKISHCMFIFNFQVGDVMVFQGIELGVFKAGEWSDCDNLQGWGAILLLAGEISE